MNRTEVIKKLELCFTLAPNDDEYFRILVKDYLAYLKTGKRSKQRADEAFERAQSQSKSG